MKFWSDILKFWNSNALKKLEKSENAKPDDQIPQHLYDSKNNFKENQHHCKQNEISGCDYLHFSKQISALFMG